VSRVHELEQRLARTEQQLRLLQKISRFLVRETKLQDALDSVVSLVVEFMECDSCLLYLLDNRELVLRANALDTGRQRDEAHHAQTAVERGVLDCLRVDELTD